MADLPSGSLEYALALADAQGRQLGQVATQRDLRAPEWRRAAPRLARQLVRQVQEAPAHRGHLVHEEYLGTPKAFFRVHAHLPEHVGGATVGAARRGAGPTEQRLPVDCDRG